MASDAKGLTLGMSYEPPVLTVVGSVYALTEQQDKQYGETDGFTFLGQPITNNSP